MKKHQMDDLDGVLTEDAVRDILNHIANPEGGDIAYMARMGAALSAAGAAITEKVKEELAERIEAGDKWEEDGVVVTIRKPYKRARLKKAYSAAKHPEMYTQVRVAGGMTVKVNEKPLV